MIVYYNAKYGENLLNYGGVMLFKQVKEYSKRQRINLNKDDGLNPGDNVVVLTSNEYDNIKKDILQLQDQAIKLEKENQILKSQDQNLKEIIQDVTTPIYENHKKDLENKDLQIKQLSNELKALQFKINQYNLDMQGLNLIDIAILRKHKKLIKDFNSTISINADSGAIDIDAGTPAIPGDNER